ncbi:CP family cyanate transporter-like MFS transporter [Nocardioides luteus]|uniref:MFS transporter n=1 Tax=Nocardioides luteus TaxID=1844 RepID=UPI00166C1EE6|nr:MFS transporter [Nocardioides luteus]MDR7310188.1 CP family cyanate transporter-like MFS transporter [Nocardioides luteus]
MTSRLQSRAEPASSKAAGWSTVLMLVAVLLVAANLRGAITSLGALLDSLDGLSAGTRSFLTSLPVLCFAVVGATGMSLARRFGVHRGVGIALGLLTVGLLVRAIGAPWLLLLGTFVACAGIAFANVLLPAVVKEHFPTRVGAVTGAYSAVLSLGSAIAAGVTVPIAHAAGSWRVGLGVWAVLALLALLAWLPHLRDRDLRRGGHIRVSLWREPVAWAVTILFGTQSLFAYVVMSWLPSMYADAGFSHATAGLLLAVSILVGVPVFFLAPTLAIRARTQGHLVAGLTAMLAAGFTGLWIAPVSGAWLWAVLLGVGGAVFPVTLTLFSIRTATTAGTTALSSMAQSIGYLLAAGGPFVLGLLREATGSWSVPIALLLGVAVVQICAGYVAGRPILIGAREED